MRMMMKMSVPVEAGNEALRSGRLPQLLGDLLDRMRPEATYFVVEDGRRGAHIVFDLQDPSMMPISAEPLYQELNARVEFVPVMKLEDMQKGLAGLQQ